MRKSIALAITAATTAGLAAFVPATANAACAPAPLSCTGDTLVTATIGSVGVISIAVSPAGTLVGTSSPATGTLGLTTVTDTQTGSHSWAVTVKSTDFSLVGDATKTIPATNAKLWLAAAPVVVPATASFASYPQVGTEVSLTNTAQGFLSASATNANTTTFTPSMSLSYSGTDPVGVYTGTVTQTVS